VEKIRVDKNPEKMEGNESHSVPLQRVLNEVIQSIESVDKKIEQFYEIHGTELQVPSNNRPTFRTVK
jgi:hypothetical protein